MDKFIKQIDFPIIESSYIHGKFDTFDVQTCIVTFSTIGRNSLGHVIHNKFPSRLNKTFSLFKRVKSIIITFFFSFFFFFAIFEYNSVHSRSLSPSLPVRKNTKISYLGEKVGYMHRIQSNCFKHRMDRRIGFNRPCSDIIL